MSRILFAWELGGGYGHLGPFLPVAHALTARGHEVVVAAREVERANAVFKSPPVRVVQAPLCTKTYGGLEDPPLNYAEILMRYGYLDAPLLAGLVRAWRDLFELAGPDALVVDHAPTALLAARGAGFARVVFGSPFTVPPSVSPTPNMRPWMNVPAERLASSDASVLKVIGASLPPRVPGLAALHELFDGAERLMAGTPEIDHYGARAGLAYLGLYSTPIGTSAARWPEGNGKRVFAYLHGDYRHLEATLAALSASGARALVYLLGSGAALRQKHPRLAFCDELLELDAVLADADACVCHGNSGTVMSSLRAGKPVLLLPAQLEHFLMSVRLERLGMARMVHPDVQPLDIGGALADVMGNPARGAAARAFAETHREPAVDTIVQRATDRIEALAGNGGGRR